MDAKEKAEIIRQKAIQAKKKYFEALENGKDDWGVELVAWQDSEKIYAVAATEAIFSGQMTMDEALS